MAQSKKPKLSSRGREFLEKRGRVSNRWLARRLGFGDVFDEAHLFATYLERQLLLTDLANLRDETGILFFWRRHARKIRPEWEEDLIGIRDALRIMWGQPECELSEALLNAWLDWAPSPSHLELYRHLRCATSEHYLPFSCFVKASKLVPDCQSLRAMLIQGFFENWRHFKHCTNPDCLAPYFIAKRRDQTVCDAEICKAEKQREHARRWWNENRAKKSQKKAKATSKTTKKRSEENVQKKAK